MVQKKPPVNVLALIGKALESKRKKKPKPQVIPEGTLMGRIRRRQDGK